MGGRHQKCQGRLDGEASGRREGITTKTSVDLLGKTYWLGRIYSGQCDRVDINIFGQFKKSHLKTLSHLKTKTSVSGVDFSGMFIS